MRIKLKRKYFSALTIYEYKKVSYEINKCLITSKVWEGAKQLENL